MIRIEIGSEAWAAHPNPTVGGESGQVWIACACGWYITGKPSVRAARRSFKQHRQNAFATAHGSQRYKVAAS